MINFINSIKFKLIRIVESNPILNLFIYNNISLFKPFLPHEKDYYGMKLLINNKITDSIIEKGIDLEKSSIRLPEGTLKEVGEYSIDIELHPEVVQGIKVVITAKE